MTVDTGGRQRHDHSPVGDVDRAVRRSRVDGGGRRPRRRGRHPRRAPTARADLHHHRRAPARGRALGRAPARAAPRRGPSWSSTSARSPAGSTRASPASRGSRASRYARRRSSPTPPAPLLAAVAVFAAYTGAILPAERRQQRGLVAPAVVHRRVRRVDDVRRRHARPLPRAEAADGHAHGTEEVADGHGHAARHRGSRRRRRRAAADAADGHGALPTRQPRHGDGHAHTADEATADDGHVHIIDPADDAAAEPAALAWPRPWDPTQPIDLSGVDGVTIEQEVRATKLVEDTLVELPRFADPAAAIAAGYSSIGDAGTGSEHFIKGSTHRGRRPPRPARTRIARLPRRRRPAHARRRDVHRQRPPRRRPVAHRVGRPADDVAQARQPLLVGRRDGVAKVVGIIDANGNCANGVRTGGENPMVHVWVQPHPCGVFAALEGIGAGTAACPRIERVDMCSRGTRPRRRPRPRHAAVAKPYDPTLPIDLSGTPGVTPQQQAAAENLIAVTLVELPQWSDYRVAEAAGFKSIGDGATGHEHFVQWDWIERRRDPRPGLPREPRLRAAARRLEEARRARCTWRPSRWRSRTSPNIGGALDAVAHPQQPLLLGLARASPGRRHHEPERRLPDRLRQPTARADDPRVDRAAGVRAVRRARGRRCRPDRGRRRNDCATLPTVDIDAGAH